MLDSMPAIRRAIKKTTYAAGFFGIITLVIAIFLIPQLLNRRNVIPPPPPVESIIIESVDTVSHGATIDIVARVRNPNPRDGVANYEVIFVLVDDEGQEIERIPRSTYLLPGSLNYIAALEVSVPANLDRVKLEIDEEPNFTKLRELSEAPVFNTFLRSRQIKNIGAQRFEVQKGVVTNRGTLGYRSIDVTGVALDSTGKVVGVSTTFIGEFQVGDQREFTLQWPEPETLTERVVVLPAANIYLEDNVLHLRGDPNRLRESSGSEEEAQGGAVQGSAEQISQPADNF